LQSSTTSIKRPLINIVSAYIFLRQMRKFSEFIWAKKYYSLVNAILKKEIKKFNRLCITRKKSMTNLFVLINNAKVLRFIVKYVKGIKINSCLAKIIYPHKFGYYRVKIADIYNCDNYRGELSFNICDPFEFLYMYKKCRYYKPPRQLIKTFFNPFLYMKRCSPNILNFQDYIYVLILQDKLKRNIPRFVKYFKTFFNHKQLTSYIDFYTTFQNFVIFLNFLNKRFSIKIFKYIFFKALKRYLDYTRKDESFFYTYKLSMFVEIGVDERYKAYRKLLFSIQKQKNVKNLLINFLGEKIERVFGSNEPIFTKYGFKMLKKLDSLELLTLINRYLYPYGPEKEIIIFFLKLFKEIQENGEKDNLKLSSSQDGKRSEKLSPTLHEMLLFILNNPELVSILIKYDKNSALLNIMKDMVKDMATNPCKYFAQLLEIENRLKLISLWFSNPNFKIDSESRKYILSILKFFPFYPLYQKYFLKITDELVITNLDYFLINKHQIFQDGKFRITILDGTNEEIVKVYKNLLKLKDSVEIQQALYLPLLINVKLKKVIITNPERFVKVIKKVY
ncbi:MAG: hypothetical protein ACK4NF_05580, partial [Planctomycetota bacterium]